MAISDKSFLIVVITASSLVACSPWLVNNASVTNNAPEITPISPVSTANSQKSDPERIPDAPYLQTPEQVVIKMLEIAQVNQNDVVYDLGSGDGRIVIAAAQRFGARAIGIEIDPELIRDSEREAKIAIAQFPTISNRIKFIKQDLFKTDLTDATVITLYLNENTNLRVKSEILPKLKLGTRIVSYQYSLDDLPPTQTQKVKVGDREQMIYLYEL
jgi:SAM-dependent methyltransferase